MLELKGTSTRGEYAGRNRVAAAAGFRLTRQATRTYSWVVPSYGPRGKIEVAKKRKPKDGQVIGFVGVGLDASDGHQRVTKSEYFFLIGGSHETHEQMQDTAVRFTEELHRRGKKLPHTPVEEVLEILHEARE